MILSDPDTMIMSSGDSGTLESSSSIAPRVVGATPLSGHAWRFCVWAPSAARVYLHLKTPDDRLLPMASDTDGYWQLDVPALPTGATYLYRLADSTEHFEEWPDPASRSPVSYTHLTLPTKA